MENQNEATCVVLSREQSFDLYGSWFGNNASPADMVCWCDGKSRSTRNGLRTARNSN